MPWYLFFSQFQNMEIKSDVHYLSVGPLTPKLENVQNSMSSVRLSDYLFHALLSAAFLHLLPFHILIPFCIFLLSLSQGTPTSTLKVPESYNSQQRLWPQPWKQNEC